MTMGHCTNMSRTCRYKLIYLVVLTSAVAVVVALAVSGGHCWPQPLFS
jgi:hypothetical protein